MTEQRTVVGYIDPIPASEIDIDVVPQRIGEWMHTSTGKRFFPQDPRAEEICIGDIANGLAMDCRYSGQGRVDRYYSVAEHCCHLARYALRDGAEPLVCFGTLMHDAAEGYINDLSRCTKHAIGAAYENLENNIQAVIHVKYGLDKLTPGERAYIKDLDRRIVPLEKAAIMRYPQPWAYDQFKPLDGVKIECWNPIYAKEQFLHIYLALMGQLWRQPEEYEI